MKLNHVAIWTKDFEQSARFLCDHFDAEIGEPYKRVNRLGFTSRFVTLPNEPVRIELMHGPWVLSNPGETIGWAHVAYSIGSVSGVDAAARRFDHDRLLVSQPRRIGDGSYEAVVRSPEGLLIELVA